MESSGRVSTSTWLPIIPSFSSRETWRTFEFFSVGNRIVSHSAMWPCQVVHDGCRFGVGMLCAVATDPEFRSRGFASRVVEDCLARMRDEGCDFGVLWTMVPGAYFRTGWEVVASNGWAYTVPEEEARYFRQTHAVRPYRAETDLEQMIAIHELMPSQVVRGRSAYEALYTLPKIHVWVAEEGTTISGYLVVAEGYNKAGAVEWRGSLAALESLLAHVLPGAKTRPLEILVPLGPNPMSELLTSRASPRRVPMEESKTSGPKMVRIVSLKGLLEHLVPHIEAQFIERSSGFGLVVRETGERVSVRIEKGRASIGTVPTSGELTLSLREMARLIFGPQKPSAAFELPSQLGETLDHLFPFYFHVWMLDHV